MRICENCHNNPVFGTDKNTGIGYCLKCQWKRTDLKKCSSIENFIRTVKKKDLDKEQKKYKLWEWFKLQRPTMTGICANCGGKTEKNNDDKFHYSICHIFPKNKIESIATNNLNWIELCHYGNSCHTNFDNGTLGIKDIKCRDEILQKARKLIPLIDKKERKHIPEKILKLIDT